MSKLGIGTCYIVVNLDDIVEIPFNEIKDFAIYQAELQRDLWLNNMNCGLHD